MTTARDVIDDVLIYALFPQIGLKFLKNQLYLKILKCHLHLNYQMNLKMKKIDGTRTTVC